jgi:serine/threonine-protein kinase
VKLFDSGQVSLRGVPVFFGLMEWIDGADLATTQIPMLEQEVWTLIGQIATGIGALSDKHVVHRDIKPDNIVRRTSGEFVLIDLGYAKHLDRSTLTQKNRTCGTEGYIAPELMMGFRPTFRADLFSLGIVAYLMASGNHPYRWIQDLVGKIPVLPISTISEDLNAIILRLLSLRPPDRARSWEEVRDACGH